jgi:hypothetical protein
MVLEVYDWRRTSPARGNHQFPLALVCRLPRRYFDENGGLMARHILPPHLAFGVDRHRPARRDDVRHAEYPNARSFPSQGASRYLSGSSSMQFVLFEDRFGQSQISGSRASSCLARSPSLSQMIAGVVIAVALCCCSAAQWLTHSSSCDTKHLRVDEGQLLNG